MSLEDTRQRIQQRLGEVTGGEADKMVFDKGVPLAPVFNLLKGNEGRMHYSPLHTNVEAHINYPQEEEKKFESSY